MTTSESFELTISPKYVPDWGKWEAFRELMQNVVDRQNEMPNAEIIFGYNPTKGRITIGNKLSYLDRSTLILGETTKAGNNKLVGKYGEGYKLALLVLMRLGVRTRIRTANEIWAPEIRFSKQFKTDLLTIQVHQAIPSDNLLFEMDGITPEDYSRFKERCLFLDPPVNKLATSYGEILLDEQLRSKIFVEGLYVCTMAESDRIRYGYNMKAPYIDLDRDRRKVGSYNLTWELGRMYAELDATHASMIYALQREWRDCSCYENHTKGKGNPLYDAVCSMHHDEFLVRYGKHAIPVKNEEEADFIREKYNGLMPIVMPTIKYEYITHSAAYSTSTKVNVVKESTPYSITKDALNKILSGKEFKAARDKMIAEFLPMTRGWYKR